MPIQPIQVVRLKVEHRQGSTYVSSTDMPGLWLWGQNPEKLFHDVPIVLQELFKLQNGKDVIARPKTIDKRLEYQFGSEREPDVYEIFPVSAAKQDGLNA